MNMAEVSAKCAEFMPSFIGHEEGKLMAASPEKFAQLLTEGIQRIRIHEGKSIRVIQDELGYLLGREGGAAVEHWRKGHLPPHLADVEQLARAIVTRGVLDQAWLEAFLRSAAHPVPSILNAELFPSLIAADTLRAGPGDMTPTRAMLTPPSQRHNLPTPPTPLIGRTHEIAQASTLLRQNEVWLVTLTGPGGSGKTRLALEIAHAVMPKFAHGVFFVDLAPIQNPALVLPIIARTLGLQETPEQPLEESLKEFLYERQILLFLDNFEQVVTAAPHLAELHHHAPRLTLLVTSRTQLRLRGEKELPVPPLALPAHEASLEGVAKSEAVQLFVARVQDVEPGFTLTESNAATVAAICTCLDGLPLAIELTATWTKVLNLQHLLERLAHPLDLLTRGSRDLAERQQTLRTAIAWSVGLLKEGEQILFRRLGVFAASFTLESAEAVSPDLSPNVLDGLMTLMEHHLIRYTPVSGKGEPRFVMLKTIHSYAFEQLAEHNEIEMVSQQHAIYLLGLAEQAEPALYGPTRMEWLERLDHEQANIESVLQWTLHQGQLESALRLVADFWWFWFLHGYWHEGRSWLERVMAENEASVSERTYAKAVCGAGVLALFQGDYAAANTYLTKSLAGFREIGDKQGAAYVQIFLGLLLHWTSHRTKAVMELESSVEILRQTGEQWELAMALNFLGHATSDVSLIEESLFLCQTLGDLWGEAAAFACFGHVAVGQNDFLQAIKFYERSLTLNQELGDKRGIAYLSRKLGEALQFQGDYEQAATLYEESLVLFQKLGHKRDMAWCLYRMGEVANYRGDNQVAKQLYRTSLQLFQKMELSRDVASFFEEQAYLAESKGQPERAVRLLAVAETFRKVTGIILPPVWQQNYERFKTRLRNQLGNDLFDQAWAEGEQMTQQEAIEYALGNY
jgi:predicted ATPase